MSSANNSSPLQMPGWREILDKMEQSLTQVEAAVFAREKANQPTTVIRPNLENAARLRQQLDAAASAHGSLNHRVQRLEEAVKATCSLLQSEEDTLRQWLQDAAALRSKSE